MLVQPLFDGPIDIVGDVHGEVEALRGLLSNLGYSKTGIHPQGRRLVFVGDLTDRGPDSPAVIRWVGDLIERGVAQCVAGNHELNILRGENKGGNSWFFGKHDRHLDGTPTSEALADEATRTEVLSLLRTLPLALEREDARVVHACWHPEAIERVRTGVHDVGTMSRLVDKDVPECDFIDYDEPFVAPPAEPDRASTMAQRQNAHAVRVLTSGMEEPAERPFFAGGKWRYCKRHPWWKHYDGPLVVVGHYWRAREQGKHFGKGVDLFGASDPLQPIGNVMVVDYSVGRRAGERYRGSEFLGVLAAYRLPERIVVFSD